MRLISLTVCMLLALPAQAAAPEQLAELDALNARRSDPAVQQQLSARLDAALVATPLDFELIWRSARLKQWQGDGSPDKEVKKRLGQDVWALGERARTMKPERVEGHYYAALGIGLYSQGVGVIKALSQGLEGKFNERLDASIRMDPGLQQGGPLLAKGRYYYELPWPKRNLGKSAALFRQALQRYPDNLRTWLYLAETLLEDDEPQQAKVALQKVFEGRGAYDPAEAQRVKQWAKQVQVEIEKELK